MGFFNRLFGAKSEPKPDPEPEPEPAPPPVAVIILRRGMRVPAPDYLDQVISTEYPGGLSAEVHRIGLSQPSWFKTEEVADSMASDVAATFALKFSLEAYNHRRRVLAGPEGAPLMLVELFRD